MTENYSDLSEDKFVTLAIRCRPAELQRLDNEWKGKGKFFTRAQFVKSAINNMSEEAVFK